MQNRLIGIALAAVVLTGSAYADAVFTLGDHPQPNEQNVLFHTLQTSTTVNGFTNLTDTMVVFTSSQQLTAKGGQSDVDAVNLDLRNITITVPGDTFNDYILNPFKDSSGSNISVTVVMSDGHKVSFGPYGGKGNNFLTITTTGGEKLSKILVTSTGGLEGLKQNRVSGVEPAVIPEPFSLLLLGSGVLILAQGLRRKPL